MMNAMIEEWVNDLLLRNDVQNIGDLKQDMVIEEKEEIIASIGNEKLWALGAPTRKTCAMHLGNIENYEEYIVFLDTLLPGMYEESGNN